MTSRYQQTSPISPISARGAGSRLSQLSVPHPSLAKSGQCAILNLSGGDHPERPFSNRRGSMLTVAVGDIHGEAAKLARLLFHVEKWLYANAPNEPRRFVFLGDYIDRGPHAREALETVQRLQSAGAVCLRGNHEELMLRAERSERDMTNFLANGGEATLASLATPAAFHAAQDWMRTLPLSYEDKLRYYVHAGVDPATPLDQQTDEARLWIRDDFLCYRGLFAKYVVHGHTPTIYLDPRQTTPDVRRNRCNLDTGAAMGGSCRRRSLTKFSESRSTRSACRGAVRPLMMRGASLEGKPSLRR